MKTYMTVHAFINGEWVYVRKALTKDWAEYDSASNCAAWKKKTSDVLGEDFLVQCVPAEVKQKFDSSTTESIEIVIHPTDEQRIVDDIMGPFAVWGVFLAVFCFGVAGVYLMSRWMRRNIGPFR